MPLSEHLPFDLIAVMPDFTSLRRMQVKYRAAKNGIVEIPFRSNYYDSKPIYSKRVNFDEIDGYSVYCPDTDQCYYLRVDEIHETAIAAHLRLAPTRNGHIKRVRLAEDFNNPQRMTSNNNSMNVIHREVSELDELAIAKVSAMLVEAGIQPCPAVSQYLPFDLIAVHPNMKTLKRLRVGWGSVHLTPYADQYAVYDPLLKRCFLFDAADIPPDKVRITVEPIDK